ncbi:hypothetical protein [Azospirillum brasilense]|uniref:hypothetical protein n=1 Tax=Azospirillum brasilense TaxID=192 RepID=UPI001EDB0909|nr:hypothetical protein [Azospirillum brasilense]
MAVRSSAARRSRDTGRRRGEAPSTSSSGQSVSGSARPAPRGSNSTTWRDRRNPAVSDHHTSIRSSTASPLPKGEAPGPPSRNRTGSGDGCLAVDSRTTTGRRKARVTGRSRRSGTPTVPHSAASSGTENQQGPGTKRGSALAGCGASVTASKAEARAPNHR